MEKCDKKIIGAIGERLAIEYLQKCGYKLLEHNYKVPFGEIDIICLDKKDIKNPVYIFLEVKYRSSNRFGLPREAITKQKQLTIKKVATYYLKQKKLFEKVSMRFDCIEVWDGELGKEPKINLITNIF